MSMPYFIQKLLRDDNKIVLKFPSDRTTSLKIINEKQVNRPLNAWQFVC